MWSDNETTTDLLGFEPYAKIVADLVRDPDLLPLTVGIFGDWGSGKSSLMGMVGHAVSADDVVVVNFQPWLHKDYDDVKGALMVAILDALDKRRSTLSKVAGFASESATEAMRKIAKRVDWMRLLGFLAKTGVGAALTHAGHPSGMLGIVGGVSDLGHVVSGSEEGGDVTTSSAESGDVPKVLKDESGVEVKFTNNEPIEREISAFRHDFEELIATLNMTALVVLVDDIDRCLPPTIVDVLEAIRLFFAVPKTAFIIGADERIIRHALATKYPEVPELAVDLGREYLEKIIQIPVYVPKLAPGDIQTYMHLLVLQKHLGTADVGKFETLRQLAAEHRGRRDVASAMNYGIARPHIEGFFPQLHADLAVISQIAPVLANFLNGKPREAKRFLNALYLRRALAEKLNLKIAFDVLAKMMVLEYFDIDVYRKLYSSRREDGTVEALSTLEEGVETPGIFADVLNRPRVARWMDSEPRLKGVDLTPYFTLGHERLIDVGVGVQRLPEHLQRIVVHLADASEAVRGQAVDDFKRLEPAEQRLVFDNFTRAVTQKPSPDAQISLVRLASTSPALHDDLARAFVGIPPESVTFNVPVRIVRELFPARAPTSEFIDLFERWIGQAANQPLQRAAKRALQLPPTPRRAR